MSTKSILANAIKVITLIFGAFGSFFLKIAPPDELGIAYSIGISSFLGLFILLLISSFSKKYSDKKYTKIWYMISIGCCVIAFSLSLVYYNTYNDLTFNYPPGNLRTRYTQGTLMTEKAKHFMDSAEIKNIPDLVFLSGGLPNRTEVWESKYIKKAAFILVTNYTALVIFFMTAIFILTEVTFPRTRKSARS